MGKDGGILCWSFDGVVGGRVDKTLKMGDAGLEGGVYLGNALG